MWSPVQMILESTVTFGHVWSYSYPFNNSGSRVIVLEDYLFTLEVLFRFQDCCIDN